MFKCFCRAALHANSESYVERSCRSDSKVPQIFSLSSRDQLKHRKCLSWCKCLCHTEKDSKVNPVETINELFHSPVDRNALVVLY